MRIGLYGLPCSGKTYILNSIKSLNVFEGSKLLCEYSPKFHSLTKDGKTVIRKQLAKELLKKDNFIMDGHYSFGDNVVFTEEDGNLYDVIIYLYVRPDIIVDRMENSEKNEKYLIYNVEQWQNFEVEKLREYCHIYDKDFYVIDNPVNGCFINCDIILEFIDCIVNGFSCKEFAQQCANEILKHSSGRNIYMTDGDKTLSLEDTSSLIGYKTNIFDGNFYTGFQSWLHTKQLLQFMTNNQEICNNWDVNAIKVNERIVRELKTNAYIVTSGYSEIWKKISEKWNIPFFSGECMSADAKYYIVKYLQKVDKCVIAYGDGMNDYYMLRQADVGKLVLKPDGTVSRSLKGKELEGLIFVHTRKNGED